MSDESVAGADYRPGPESGRKLGVAEWSMILAIGLPWLWKRRPSSLQSFDDTRKLTLNVLIVAAGFLLALMVVKATLEKLMVIDPISVPKSLEEMGYTGTIVAQRLIDQAHAIGEEAKTNKERVRIGNDSQYASLSSIQLPASGLTIKSMVAALRDLLGVEDRRIGGEITIKRAGTAWFPARYGLLLRFSGPSGRTTGFVESENLDELMKLSARAIVNETDPYVLAVYLHRIGASEDRDRLIDRMIASKDTQLTKWALTMRGSLLAEDGEFRQAASFYEMAIKLDWQFAVAYYNWGNLLMEMQDHDGAIEKYRKATEFRPSYEEAHYNWALALLRKSDVEGGTAKLRKRSKVAGNAAEYRALWARVLAVQRKHEEAVDQIREALAINPSCLECYLQWAELLTDKRAHDEAIEQIRIAMALEPKATVPRLAWATVLERKGAFDDAVEKYREVMNSDPKRYGHLEGEIFRASVFRDKGAGP
ncbi:lipopolysaccharide assembly protein LapB [Reyranella sp.]|uniref:tetratricopeptide repeat protein n=1 Tax=Reyranella sp. TaxID=1929291 RepID=UPI0027319CA6|nr:tetratricopeptide repeat protein [Reyranella sp.]MDP2377344.1 tetratricopeptide repeat protein [Reyranella sp.]